MGQSPTEVRQDIERTRDELTGTIEAIADRTSPRRIAVRQRRRMSARVHRMRDTVMGSAEGAYGTVHDGARSVTEAAQHGAGVAVDQIREAPAVVKRETQGSPLAAGLIAFGAGALAAALIPSSRTERQAAARLQAEAQPAVDELKHAGEEIAGELKQSAREAVDQVKATASDSAHEVATEAKTAAHEVKEQVRSSPQ
jgi:hypothetical protein